MGTEEEAVRIALLEKFNATTTPEATDKIARDLLETSPSANAISFMLNLVARRGSGATASLLLQKGAKIYNDVIYNAVKNHRGSMSVLQALIDSGWDVNTNVKYQGDALVIAIYYNNVDAVRLLLKSGAHPTMNQGSEGRTTLAEAALRGSPEIISMLVESGAEIERSRALELGARAGRKDNVLCLLEKGADVNEVSDPEWWNVRDDVEAGVGLGSALHAAASEGHSEIISLLLENGANVRLEDSKGQTALRRAVSGFHFYTAALLAISG